MVDVRFTWGVAETNQFVIIHFASNTCRQIFSHVFGMLSHVIRFMRWCWIQVIRPINFANNVSVLNTGTKVNSTETMDTRMRIELPLDSCVETEDLVVMVVVVVVVVSDVLILRNIIQDFHALHINFPVYGTSPFQYKLNSLGSIHRRCHHGLVTIQTHKQLVSNQVPIHSWVERMHIQVKCPMTQRNTEAAETRPPNLSIQSRGP